VQREVRSGSRGAKDPRAKTSVVGNGGGGREEEKRKQGSMGTPRAFQAHLKV
jgi:hypothetical protein